MLCYQKKAEEGAVVHYLFMSSKFVPRRYRYVSAARQITKPTTFEISTQFILYNIPANVI